MPGARLQRALALAAAADAGNRDSALHQARKAAKRARYAAEAAGPALGARAAHQAAWARELQEKLGDHHDSVVARAVLSGLAETARSAGEDTFTYGLLYERQACQAAQIEGAVLSDPARKLRSRRLRAARRQDLRETGHQAARVSRRGSARQPASAPG